MTAIPTKVVTLADELKDALLRPRPLYQRAAALSVATGLLALAPSWYMFEVYGRVLNSRNLETLLWLSVAVVGAYVVVELLEVARARILTQAARQVEQETRGGIFGAAFEAALRKSAGGNTQPFTDLRTVRDFIGSPAITTMLDLPAALLCMALLFVISPVLGAIAVVGAIVQTGMLWLTERRTMPMLNRATAANIRAQHYASSTQRNAQVIEAMGMLPGIFARWTKLQREFLGSQAAASDYGAGTAATAKLVQTMQGSVLMGAACWVMLNHGLLGGAGMVIVASILGGRALQPLAQLVTHWRVVINARDAYSRLQLMLSRHVAPEPGMALPAPKGVLTVEALTASPPGVPVPVLRNINFVALPGELTMIIGPSAAGKSTLARQLVGVWPAAGGKVRLDSADVHAWDKSELGPHIGYLPQTVELFDGTVAENIARFGKVDMQQVRAAADLVGISATLDALPQGFDTRIGEAGAILSGGQRQRVALARALYGEPRLIVLDEPNASLDQAGEHDLLQTLTALKQRGATVLAISHRKSMLPVANRLLVLNDGQVAAFGPRDEVLAAMQKATQQAQAQTQPRPAAPAQPALTGAAR